MSGYAQPAAQTSFDLKNHGQEYLGKLMLIWPTNVMRNVQTSQGIVDTVVECDLAVIDKIDPLTGQPEYLQGVRLWWTVLANQTKNEVGGKVLGRLGQGANTKGSPPWLLQDWTDQDAAMAQQYEAAHPRNQPTQPSAAAAGTQGQPWTAAPPAPPAAAAPAWNAAPPPAAAPPQQQWQQQAPAAAWNAAPPAAPAPPPPPANGIEAWPPGLADFLRSKNVDVNNVPDEGTARQIAATYQ